MDSALEQGIEQVLTSYKETTKLECHFLELDETEMIISDVQPDCTFCRSIQSSGFGLLSCRNQRQTSALAAITDDTWKVSACHAGLLEWIVPVFFQGKPVGIFVSGFVFGSGKNVQEVRIQKTLYEKKYGIGGDEFERVLVQVPQIKKEQIQPYAQLLFVLTQTFIWADRSFQPAREVDTSDIILFSEDESLLKEIPSTHPLSYYICDNEMASHSMHVFWKTVETKANSVFANILAGRTVESRMQFDEVMNMAYIEPDLSRAKISAETLFHIIFLKYYSKDTYDTRFYRLAYETIQKLFDAQSIEDIQSTMSDSFNRMNSFYNADSQSRQKNTVIVAVMQYLEKNYHRDIKIDDVAKSVYMSPAYISRLFKKETSVTIKWCLNNIRMQHAQELLIQTEMPIKDISVAVGYDDIRAFYKMFAKHFGITCSEMRKKYAYIG